MILKNFWRLSGGGPGSYTLHKSGLYGRYPTKQAIPPVQYGHGSILMEGRCHQLQGSWSELTEQWMGQKLGVIVEENTLETAKDFWLDWRCGSKTVVKVASIKCAECKCILYFPVYLLFAFHDYIMCYFVLVDRKNIKENVRTFFCCHVTKYSKSQDK